MKGKEEGGRRKKKKEVLVAALREASACLLCACERRNIHVLVPIRDKIGASILTKTENADPRWTREGRPVYECNSMCKCNSTCPNRVLQKGVQVKLEIFRTENKGWAVRAREAISRGTFVCEYIGELLNNEGANKEGGWHVSGGCSYLFDIDAHIDSARGLIEGAFPYVIDATKYGNVARFINHSCSPNLASYFVFVDNMDFQLAHIGLYASRDIDFGEELAYDYRSKLLPGEGHLCHCGATNCRGRLY